MFTAQVVDKDLRQPLSGAQVAELKRSLYTNLVLVFRDQRLTDSEFVQFARQLGETTKSDLRKSVRKYHDPYRKDFPEILVVDKSYDPIDRIKDGKKRIEGWHSDPRVLGERDEIGILRAVKAENVVPTQWLDMRAAHAAMPLDNQHSLKGLIGIHRYAISVKEFHRPLVARHPVTGRLSLDLHEGTLFGILGMDQNKGRGLIDDLFSRVVVPEHIYTHEWKTNDLVVWDNLSLVHRRLGPITAGRTLHRIYVHQEDDSEAREDPSPRTNTANWRKM